MGETNKQKAPKTSWFTGWFHGLKAELGKVIWPDKKSLARQTTAVVVVSFILGLIIAIIDVIVKYGIDILVNL
ncbi:preprotein translocase subunit SecE [Lachnospiraceae bacterium ZAX-1]